MVSVKIESRSFIYFRGLCDKRRKTFLKSKQPFEKRKKKSLCVSESLSVVHKTHIRLISWSKPIRDSEGQTLPLIGRAPHIPVRVCASENACAAAVRQRER